MSVTVSDENWMQRLWEWADRYKISKKTLPRKEGRLLKMKHLRFMVVYFGIEKREVKQYSWEEPLFLSNGKRVDDLKYEMIKGEFPEELGKLTQLESLCIVHNFIEKLPASIVNLKNLKKLCLCNNNNLVLTLEQKMWMWELESNGAIVEYDEHLGA